MVTSGASLRPVHSAAYHRGVTEYIRGSPTRFPRSVLEATPITSACEPRIGGWQRATGALPKKRRRNHGLHGFHGSSMRGQGIGGRRSAALRPRGARPSTTVRRELAG